MDMDALLVIVRLDSDAPIAYADKWTTICDAMTPRLDNNIVKLRDAIVTEISTRLKMEGVGRPIDQEELRRSERGFGGGNNMKNRQLRFHEDALSPEEEVRLIAIDSGDGTDRWTLLELIKFKQVIQKALEQWMTTECLHSMIVITDMKVSDPERACKLMKIDAERRKLMKLVVERRA